MNGARILAVDDDSATRQALSEMLAGWGFKAETALDGKEALRKAFEFQPDVVLSDLAMPETDGLWLLRAIKEDFPDCPIIFLTGRGSIDAAVEVIRQGAYDFIEKPVDPARLRVCITRALETREARREVQGLKQRLGRVGPGEFVGNSGLMRRVIELVEKVAPSKAAVAISGDSGTGKEMVARAIHNLSPRRDQAFVAVNCASIPSTLMESEIFGHERGAFTGADQRRAGVFELAHGGTLFLDEVGEIPVELQPKLLRVLEESKLRRLGGKQEIEVDVRVVSATNKDLKAEVQRSAFREDLYFRLNVFQIALPPLRERREDIPLLVQHFINKLGSESGKHISGIQPEAMASLQSYDWPGNIRELRNAIERALILCDDGVLGREHLPPDLPGRVPEKQAIRLAFGLPLDLVEKEYILYSLARNGGNKAKTAVMLGISEKTLYNKLNRYSSEERLLTSQRIEPGDRASTFDALDKPRAMP